MVNFVERHIRKLKEYWKITLVIVGIFLSLIFYFAYQQLENTNKIANQEFFQETTEMESNKLKKNQKSKSNSTPKEIYVDIKGAVKFPGLYTISNKSRIFDVIQKAGGFLEDAATEQVNFAQKTQDQMVIYIPKIGEVLSENIWLKNSTIQESTVPEDSLEESSSNSAKEKVNINTADSLMLQRLSGIGQKKAEEIINHRESKGLFKSIEDLKSVNGIGEGTFQKIKSDITIS